MTQCEGNHSRCRKGSGGRECGRKGCWGARAGVESSLAQIRRSENFYVQTGILRCSLLLWEVSVNRGICLEWLYSSAGSMLSARILKLWVRLRNPGMRCVELCRTQAGREAGNEPCKETSTTSWCCYDEPHLKYPRKPLKKIAWVLVLFLFFRVGTSMWFNSAILFFSKFFSVRGVSKSFLWQCISLSLFFLNGICFLRATSRPKPFKNLQRR